MLPSKPEPDKVLLLPELLEAILLQIDQRTLLLSQRVCRQWKDVIQNSKQLQIKLYFKPLRFRWSDDDYDVHHERNPMIERLIWPMILEYYRNRTPEFCRKRGIDVNKFPKLDTEKQDAFMRKEASWRRMFLHQPPCMRGANFFVKHIGNSPFSQAGFEARDNFLRFGNLEVAVLEGKLEPRSWDLAFWVQNPGSRGYSYEIDMMFHGLKYNQLRCDGECSGGGNVHCVRKCHYRYLEHFPEWLSWPGV